ncbi:toll/interleukin-1 receptor domain-containing protein [Nostocales cyanobacterium LEGE 12452]|nr:toll/interleukin-1 receptor domain-containing protein [Nostocales cyanobacterium LEGE 12452]
MSQFGVFLAHNSLDKHLVKIIAEKLKQRGLNPWLDDEQIPPGASFQDEIQQAITVVQSAAVFIGSQGLGRWQSVELKALIAKCIERKIPVIPVLLPGVSDLPEDLVFLREFRWVAFSQGIDDEDALNLLQWGITRVKPEISPQLEQPPGKIPTEAVIPNMNTPTSFQEITPQDIETLKDLLNRSGIASYEGRRALLTNINVDPNIISNQNLNLPNDKIFITNLVEHLLKTGKNSALYKLCEQIEPHFSGGEYESELQTIKAKFNRK